VAKGKKENKAQSNRLKETKESRLTSGARRHKKTMGGKQKGRVETVASVRVQNEAAGLRRKQGLTERKRGLSS